MEIRRGHLIATALSGIWRSAFPAATIDTAGFSAIAPLLLQSGAAALGWRRICELDAATSPDGFRLQQAYRLHTLQSAIHERELKKLLSFLRPTGFVPLLGKGWAIARLYPESGLRPYGDFDLYVRIEEYGALSDALRQADELGCSIDLHRGFADLDDRDPDELYARAQCIVSGAESLRVFGAEDHLRLLCLHMFRHGAWRPLWLVDVAVALESRPADFDWDYFLSGDARRTDWTACAIGLAHQLLGAEIEGTPVEARARNLPTWLVPTVLRQWGEGQTPHGARLPMKQYLQSPGSIFKVWKALKLRWPNAIEATVDVHGPFNEWPRLPFQLGDCLMRTGKFIAQLKAVS